MHSRWPLTFFCVINLLLFVVLPSLLLSIVESLLSSELIRARTHSLSFMLAVVAFFAHYFLHFLVRNCIIGKKSACASSYRIVSKMHNLSPLDMGARNIHYDRKMCTFCTRHNFWVHTCYVKPKKRKKCAMFFVFCFSGKIGTKSRYAVRVCVTIGKF